MAEKNRLFGKMIEGGLKPLPGVLDLLAVLKDGGVKVAVVSSSPLERVNASLKEVGLILEFELIVSGDCCDKGKPDPQPFLLAAKRLGVTPGECVVVEDAEAGVLAGKAAGMKVVAVKSPNTHGQDLGAADLVVDSMVDINVKVLEGL
jgi:HAD superfamily hydrolase (TIGR01509 family)